MSGPFRTLGWVALGRGVLNSFERQMFLSEDDRLVRRDRLTHPGAAVVVPVQGDAVWMLRQYRAAVDEWLWELPAGLIDPGETPEQTARRECVEEVGQAPGTLRSLGRLVTSPGILAEKLHVHLATDLTDVGRRPADEEERRAEVQLVDRVKLSELAESGVLVNAITIAALAMAGYTPGVWATDQ